MKTQIYKQTKLILMKNVLKMVLLAITGFIILQSISQHSLAHDPNIPATIQKKVLGSFESDKVIAQIIVNEQVLSFDPKVNSEEEPRLVTLLNDGRLIADNSLLTTLSIDQIEFIQTKTKMIFTTMPIWHVFEKICLMGGHSYEIRVPVTTYDPTNDTMVRSNFLVPIKNENECTAQIRIQHVSKASNRGVNDLVTILNFLLSPFNFY